MIHRETLALLGNAMDLYDNDPEAVAHEIAHGILLFGRIYVGFGDDISARIEEMSNYAANQHELRTLALQHASMHRLGRPQALRTIATGSMSSFQGRSRYVKSVASLMRAIEAVPVSERSIKMFVRVVQRFEYYVR